MKHLQKHRMLYCIILAWLSVYSLTFALKTENSSLLISNSFFSCILLISFYFLLNKGIQLLKNKQFRFCIITGCLFATFMIIGKDIYINSGIDYSASGILKKTAAFFSLGMLFASIVSIILNYTPSSNGLAGLKSIKLIWKSLIDKKYSFFLLWAVILLCWMPVFLAFYPGIFAYDVPNQVSQLYFREFTSHHPIFHTLYLGICIGIGKFAGSYNLGVAIYTLTQMSVLAAIFAFSCKSLCRWYAPVGLQAGALLFFALHPLNAMFAVSTTKDVLFTGFLLLLIIFTYDMVKNPDGFVRSYFLQIRFLLTVVLLCCFRNNGLYMIFLCIPVILLLQRKHRFRIALTCSIGLCAYLITINAVHTSLDVTKGSIAEMLSIPIQQFARVAILHEDELTPEEWNGLYTYIDEEKLMQYNAYLADPVKDGFRQEAFYENTKGFIKLWIHLGLKYPSAYIDAFLTCSLGNWYPDMNFPNMHAYMETEVKDVYLDLPFERQSKFPWLEEQYSKFAYETPQQKYPVLSMLFSPGFFSWILLFSFGLCIHSKNREGMIALMPLIGLWLTLLLAPISLMRYTYPIAAALPVIIYFILTGRAAADV